MYPHQTARTMKIPLKMTMISVVALLTAITISSCKKLEVPEEYKGEWQSDLATITVRTKLGDGWTFDSDTVLIRLLIKDDFSVEGNVGDAEMVNGQLKAIWMFLNSPEKGAIPYAIQCNLAGKIFPGDPLDSKEVQFWLGLFQEPFNAELRYTERGAQFPMGGMNFNRLNE